MKRIISIVAVIAAACTVAFAQENGNRDENGKIVRGPYVNNGFFDNTFIELQGGANFMGTAYDGLGIRSISPKAGLGVNLGKWFNPNFGLRLGWQGLSTGYNHMYGGELIKDHNPYNYTHLDFLVNISNWFSGYKETRTWDVIPYIHAGWVNTRAAGYLSESNKLNTYGAGAGLYNRIRITPRLAFTLDIRTIISDSHIMGLSYQEKVADYTGAEKFVSNFAGVASAFAGLAVNLGETGWVRKANVGKNAAAGAAAGFAIGEYIGAAKKDAKLQALQAKADAEVASSKATYEAAAAAYRKAAQKVDADGKILPAAYAVEPELAAAYADMATYESCPDFTSMTKAERAAWDKSHKDILPEGWKKMTNAQKNQWVNDTIYAPAQLAIDEKEAAVRQLADARAALNSADKTCDDAIALAQWFVDDAALRIDGNNNIKPACYPVEGAELGQKYADIANTEAFPDFTKMSAKETRAWIKAHKDILPKKFNKLSAEQKCEWVLDHIYGPAYQAKADKDAAAEELAKAKARKMAHGAVLADSAKNLDGETITDGVGYFTIGKSVFNEKQLANWKKSIKNLDKKANYSVMGYADKETGTAARNAELRKERSEYVAKLLKENGFTGTITPVATKDSDKFVSYPIWKNRSAVIK